MSHTLMQADGGGITINFPTIDWPTLIPQLVGYFFDAIGKFLSDTLRSAFEGLWGSGANVVGRTDLAMTWGFVPVHEQVLGIQSAARVILILALVFLGLRGMLSSVVPRQPSMVTEFINGVVAATIMVAAFPLLIPQLIDFTNEAANAVGRADLSAYVSVGGVNSPIIQGVLLVILLFFAIRLLIKAVWRIGFLAVLLPVGMAACALYALPPTRWMLGWWARVWGGMLLAQVPSVMALTIGAQLFAHGSGLGACVYSIAFLQLATDLYSLIPFGSTGSAGAPWGGLSLPMPALLGGAARAAGGLGAAVGVVGSVAQAATSSGPVGPTYGYKQPGAHAGLEEQQEHMGAAITSLFTNLASQASMPARAIATAVIIGIGLTLTLMPWEHGAVRFLKDSALRVAVGLAIVLNAAAIVATMSGG